MNKKSNFLWVVMAVVILALSVLGCSGTAQTTATVAAAQDTGATNSPQMTIENKLAAGTLKLEGTDQAVTADEAKALLPLWKAVKSLNSSDTASQDEIQALYDQIKETMTAGQIAAIEAMSLTREDLSALMTDLGIENNFGGGMQNADPSARATQIAQFQANNPGATMPGGGMAFPGGDAGGGMVPPGGDGAAMGGFGNRRADSGTVQGTPQAGQTGARRGMGGMGQVFIDPLITMLEERAGK